MVARNKDITLICPKNDLESVTIVSIADSLRIDVRVSKQNWGGKLGNEPEENLRGLGKTVVVVELPDPGAEEDLRRKGHEVIVIDHHDIQGLNRWQPESSLEQFCRLVDQPMNDDRWVVAVNDRDFIPGLARLGLSYEKMDAVRHRERDVRGVSELFQEALQKVRAPLRKFDDLDLFLVPARYILTMGEVAQWPSKEDYDRGVKQGVLHLRNCLILFHEEGNPNRITRLEYYGNSSFRQTFKGLLDDRRFADFEMWTGGGEHHCFWGAKPRHSTANPMALDELIDHVLSFTLVRGRPLRHFSTTFLLPFRFKVGDPPKIIAPRWEQRKRSKEEEEYIRQEEVFFLPQVRHLFFYDRPSEETGVEKWFLPVQEGEVLSIYEKDNPIPLSVPIREISLYRFFNEFHILAISTAQDTDHSFWECQPLWKALTAQEFGSKCSTLTPNQALVFNNLARIVYVSYPSQKKYGLVAKKVVWRQITWEPSDDLKDKAEISAVILAMIREFVGPDEEPDTDFLWDDRMFVHTNLVFSGGHPKHAVAEDNYHALFTLATFVDKPDSGYDHLGGYAYDREFVKKQTEQLTYRRWYEVSGNLYSFTRFSAVFFAFGKFSHETLSTHIQTLYLRMSVIALFYRASLLYYGYRVGQLKQPESYKVADRTIRSYQEELREIRWELTRFTNKYWFTELSSQDQPIEQFNIQTRAMGLENQYKRVKDDIERANELLETRASYHISRLSVVVAIAALWLTIVFLITAFFSLGFDVPIMRSIKASQGWFWAEAALLAFTVLVGGFLLGWWRKQMSRWR
jgi:hypothetical protein